MKFYMPVKVYDESGCVRKHAADLRALGKKALIVTGKRSAFSNGSYDDTTAALDEAGIEHLVFSDVEENPSTDTVFKARDMFASEGIDFVVGVGGGSPMDAAKAIALVLAQPGAVLEDLYDKEKPSDALPVVCIPTTCGTGSEVTGVSVLTRHDKKTKISMVHKVFPHLALIDGKYLSSATPELIGNSAIDALSHLYESVLNSKADDYVMMTASAGLKTWAKVKDVLTGDMKAGPEEYSLLMRASAYAGMSIAQCGTSIPHALSYTVTYDMKLAHGRAVGYFLEGFMKAAPKDAATSILNMSGFSDPSDLSSFITRVFGVIDIPDETLVRTYEAVRNNPAKMASPSFTVDDRIIHDIVFSRSAKCI